MFPRCCPTLNNTLRGERSIPAENRWPWRISRQRENFAAPAAIAGQRSAHAPNGLPPHPVFSLKFNWLR